jgi:hypothetical protein
MIAFGELGKFWKKTAVAYSKVLSGRSPGGIEENHESHQSG